MAGPTGKAGLFTHEEVSGLVQQANAQVNERCCRLCRALSGYLSWRASGGQV
jgi:hypothetical protein